MATIPFYKYQGSGNDFILIDNRKEQFQITEAQVRQICDRHFGIGADGLITLNAAENADFEMKFWNNDGSNSMMCGNGGRCIVSFAHDLKIFKQDCSFIAPDGLHHASILEENSNAKTVSLSILNTKQPICYDKNEFFINTGTPHLVKMIAQIQTFDVVNQGRLLRHNTRFMPNGTNVNFVEVISDNHLFVRTYERGVENETLSCGTGVTASAIVYAFHYLNNPSSSLISIDTLGGQLKVKIDNTTTEPSVTLIGPTVCVYQGLLYE